MRKYLPILLASAIVACTNSHTQQKAAIITFSTDTLHIGNVTQGDSVTFSFPFSNTGFTALYIQSVKSSCNCTVAQYPKDSIAPNQKEKLTVTYTPTEDQGKVVKTIVVQTNTNPAFHALYVEADVKKTAQ